MLLRDAVAMLARSGIEALGPTIRADLGCGDGTFTIALADLVAAGSTIHAGEPEQFSSPFRPRGLSVHHVPGLPSCSLPPRATLRRSDCTVQS
jgi:hypothetical protein